MAVLIMERETRLAVGIVAGVMLLAGGGLWLFSGGTKDDIAEAPPLLEFEQVSEAEAGYQEYSTEGEQSFDSDIDDMADDVTRIVINEDSRANDVDVKEALTGKVVVGDQVVQQDKR